MQYYTLEEAARLLGTSPDEVKKMAERNELRPFRDRGTMRFRGQEVEELARRLGRGSDPELQLGEAGRTGAAKPPPGGAPEVFDFGLPPEDDQVQIGQELNVPSGPSSSTKGRRSSKIKGPPSPPPKSGSDEEVRLVDAPGGGDLDFQLASDSDVKLAEDSGPKSSPSVTGPKSSPGGPKSSPRASKPPSTRKDSSVRMMPDEKGDSDVRLEGGTGRSGPLAKSPSDSDVRLDKGKPKSASKLGGKKPSSDDMMLTEEIDLDAELKKAEETSKAKPPGKHKPGSQPQLPTTSPFELSEADLGLPEEESLTLGDSSSDFDLTPAAGKEQSPLELGSDELPAAAPPADDEDVTLGELSGSGGESGINLRDPADSGISLEQQGSEEEIEFELSLDESKGNTPKPAPASGPKSGPKKQAKKEAKKEGKKEEDSSSEFELSLDDSSPSSSLMDEDASPSSSEFELKLDESGEKSDSDSEFELTLDDESQKTPDSDSEFELTLDDSGGSLPGLDEEVGLEVPEGEKDIFETDFEVPSLEDESGSQAVALEEESTDVESSDFDLDVSAEDESGSQVLALDEDSDVDEGAETVARPRKQRGGAAVLDEDEAEELLEEDMDFTTDAEGQPQGRVAAGAVAAPAEWGTMPAIVMSLSVIIMFIVGLMGFELVRGMYGYRQGGPVTSILIDPLARMFTGNEPPK